MSKDNIVLDLNLDEQVGETSYNGWTNTIQDKFEKYLTMCIQRGEYHKDSARSYSSWSKFLTIPSILLSATATIMASMKSNSPSYDPLTIAIVVISGLSTSFNAINTFLNYNAKKEKHTISAGEYMALAYKIESQLFLHPKDRDSPKFNFDLINIVLNNIISGEPLLPDNRKPLLPKHEYIKINI